MHKRIAHIIVFIFISFLPTGIYGQVLDADSLAKVFAVGKVSPKDYLQYCYDQSWKLVTKDAARSEAFARNGIAVAERENDKAMFAKLNRNLGSLFSLRAQYDSARLYLGRCIDAAKGLNDTYIESLGVLAMGGVNIRQGFYKTALAQHLQVLPVFEKAGDKQNIKRTLANIAVIYMYQENWQQAAKYYRSSGTLAFELGDSSGIAQYYEAFSKIFLEEGNYDSSLIYSRKAVDIFHSIGEYSFESVAMQRIATLYLRQGDWTKAGQAAGQSLSLAGRQNISRYVADAQGLLAEVNFAKKDFLTAKENALKALHTDSSDNDLKGRMYLILVKTGIELKDKAQAMLYFDKYRNIMAIRANENFQKSLSEMEVKYESEKKELRIFALEKQKKLYGIITMSGLLLLLSLILALYFRQKNISHKKKLIEHKVEQLEKEKQLVATQAVLDGETAERTRLARDLHDGLGGMLSAIKLNLYNVKKGIHLEGDDVASFNQALDMLETSTRELRRVAHNMMPEALARFGLKTSLQDFIRNIPNAHFHYFGDDERLDPKLEVMVYRTAYELVNNAMKHADANNINVQLVQQPHTISLTVQDDGRGFEPAENTDGSGLQNIRSRVESFNGRMDIYSRPAEGTEVNVEFKIKTTV